MTRPDIAWRPQRGTISSALRKLGRSRYGLLLVGLPVLLIVALAVLPDYGASLDEWQNAHYGRLFLETYRTGSLLRSPGINYFNGPFYFMLFTVLGRFFQHVNPRWLFTDGVHLTNYITFLVGVFFFYRLSLRMLPRGVALIAAGLFATQPVLFGHAFINQKDMPLMVFFLTSIEVGFTAVETRPPNGQRPPAAPGERRMIEQWIRLPVASRVAICLGGLLGLIVLVDLWWLGTAQGAARSIMAQIYAGRGPAILVTIFGWIAEDAYKTPLSAYLDKLDGLLSWVRVSVTLLILAGLAALSRLALPVSFAQVTGKSSTWFRRWGPILVAGILLGMTTSIRALGPFAGLVVGAYWIGRQGRRAAPGILVYGAIAMITTYLTWPVLWGNPIIALTQRALAVSDFADHTVLFAGVKYESGSLPWTYLPTLLAVQLTLPSLILFFVGVPLSWILSKSKQYGKLLMALLYLWLLLPIATVTIGAVPVYQNFRHILFALPPAFLIMGFGAWKILAISRRPIVQASLVLLALAPGLLGIIHLHPYEYIYYNELVGGITGAEGRFELDYFCTSVRKAIAVITQRAQPGDRVVVSPQLLSAWPVAPQNLKLREERSGDSEPDFAVACSWRTAQSSFFPKMRTMYEVRAEGALLAVVKERRPSP